MFRKRKFEQELDDELRSYVELQAAEKIRRGMSPEDALECIDKYPPSSSGCWIACALSSGMT